VRRRIIYLILASRRTIVWVLIQIKTSQPHFRIYYSQLVLRLSDFNFGFVAGGWAGFVFQRQTTEWARSPAHSDSTCWPWCSTFQDCLLATA
jgi:hypothetical protein